MDSPLAWSPDVLEGFEAAPLGPATLVRSTNGPAVPRAAVLHVHGYNDYFFQTHLARFFVEAGLAFLAVDLRRAGRSLRDGDIPHLVRDLDELGDDLAAATAALADLHPGLPLVVHAHSTGGLAACLWAADRPAPELAGLILDSPFFKAPTTRGQRVATGAVPLLARARPLMVVRRHPSIYARHLHVANGGRWDFDTEWKNPDGVPVRAAWLAAVQRGQARVRDGLSIDVPVLAARSHTSGPDEEDNPLLQVQDTVVDVREIARLAHRLGPRVQEAVIEGGVHELSLSSPVPRAAYLDTVRAWLAQVLA
ncbi:alpha/beta hydrolase [Demequina sp. SYSU T00039]|uniref:Alpha/beta hydrolase n=1 Tax=Demequina lignilytica TaxID=3051663 RepID=A0AAW7M0E0_9MICO|nr:alpha/beta hydrolase [Demequina sp. SYSU T00039]MDN4486564.1 alpha/beta hydrolase [Demequina sp. SYSU T00039]